METVATLVVNPINAQLDRKVIDSVEDALRAAGALATEVELLDAGIAADVFFSGLTAESARPAIAAALAEVPVDFAVQPRATRRKKLLIADMDSTMITVECIDELADFAGLKEHVAAITEAAMRGELDFESALRERVGLLKGLPEGVLQQTYDERVKLMPGAVALVKTMRANGAHAALVSGGFTFFTSRIAEACGFHLHRSNTLGIQDGVLTGDVVPPIVNSATKKATLLEIKARDGLSTHDILAVGDGANDIPMIEEAGLGVAYHAKPKTAAAASAAVNFADLTALLYFQGYRKTDFVVS